MSRTAAGGAQSALDRLDEVEVTIEKLIAGGDGFARHEGLPIFVERAAPGDLARVRLTVRKPNYARAEIVEILRPGAARREARCRHFGVCGGCDLQHIEDESQLGYKVAATLETLARIGRLDLPEPEILAGDAWGYRTRTQLHAMHVRDREEDRPAIIGYHERGSHRIVAVEECPVLVPELEVAVRRLPSLLGPDPPPRIDLAMGDGGQLTCAPVVGDLPHQEVSVRVGDFGYATDARCFFQGHRELLPALVDAVVGAESGALAVDLYAGVGLFALPLARRFERVIAVEGDRIAARYGRINGRRNGCANLEFVHQAVETWAPRLTGDCDRVLVDPPRAGLAPSVVARVVTARPRRLTYVSCHPAALARDLAALEEAYEVQQLTLVDLFPQTGHIEAVVQLVARQSPSRP